MFTSRAELLDKEETTAEHVKNHKEETERLDKDKANKDPRSGGLFGGLFKPEQPKPYVDSGDGITRCPHCHWELEDGLNCAGCGYIFHPDSDGSDLSESDLSESDYDSMLDEDEDEDEEDEEDEDDMGPPRTGNSHQYQRQQYRPPFFGFNGSHQERQYNIDQLFPTTFHPFPIQFPMHPQGVTNGQGPGARSYGGEHDDDWPDRDEDEDDSYEDSFIDDEEHLDHEDDDSQSDHSTVVGNTRPHEYSHTREAMLRSAYEAAAGHQPPIVTYPHVHHPISTSQIEDYGWDSEDDEEIGGHMNAGTSYDQDGLSRNSRASFSTDWSGTHDEMEGSESEDEDEDEDLPRARVGHRRQQMAVLSSDEDEEESESEDSSSPPRAQITRSTRPPAPRATRPPPSRGTGSNANNAITIDDSDEDPVGPIRRPSQRRQPRYSPY